MKSQNYEDFIKELNVRVSNLSVPCEIRNYADWQPNLYIKFSDIGGDMQIIKRFIREYNEMNKSSNGYLYDLKRKEYLQGKVPCGCSFNKVPQSKEYIALRNRLLSVVKEIKNCGFDIKYPISSCRYYDSICISVWNDDIEKERNIQYQNHQVDFEMENRFEIEQERAFEERYFGCI